MAYYDEAGFEPEVSIGYLARRAHQLGGQMLEPVFAAEGLTATQWSALVAVWFRRGVTAAEVARDLGHDKGAMTRLVDALAERGWLTRERTQADRRCVNLALTAAGEAVVLRCRAQVVAHWNDWLADWRHEDVDRLIELLQRLRTTLVAAEERGA